MPARAAALPRHLRQREPAAQPQVGWPEAMVALAAWALGLLATTQATTPGAALLASFGDVQFFFECQGNSALRCAKTFVAAALGALVGIILVSRPRWYGRAKEAIAAACVAAIEAVRTAGRKCWATLRMLAVKAAQGFLSIIERFAPLSAQVTVLRFLERRYEGLRPAIDMARRRLQKHQDFPLVLLQACTAGRLEVVQFFTKDIDAEDVNRLVMEGEFKGRTALGQAISNKHEAVALHLLRHTKVDRNQMHKEWIWTTTPLSKACGVGASTELIKALLTPMPGTPAADPMICDSDGCLPICAVAIGSNTAPLDLLLDAMASVKNLARPTEYACSNTYRKMTPLHHAVDAGESTAMVEHLVINKGADPLRHTGASHGWNALPFAAANGNLAFLRLLIGRAGPAAVGLKMLDSKSTLLHLAAGYTWAQPETIKYLVEEAGVDVMARNRGGQQALDLARKRQVEIAAYINEGRTGWSQAAAREAAIVAYLEDKMAASAGLAGPASPAASASKPSSKKSKKKKGKGKTQVPGESATVQPSAAASSAAVASVPSSMGSEDRKLTPAEAEADAVAGRDSEQEGQQQQQQQQPAGVVIDSDKGEEDEHEDENEEEEDEDVPEDLTCPISLQLLTDPVCASDGHTYQRQALEAHIDFCISRGRELQSPLSNTPMEPLYFPNLRARGQVMEYLSQLERRRRFKGGRKK